MEVEVYHDDRELEFILLKRELEGLFDDKVMEIDFKSCEMLADELLEYMKEKYGSKRFMIIDVSEDGENGARSYS